MKISAMLLALSLSLSGCIYSWDHTHEYSKQAFDREVANKIVSGSTTRDWVVSHLGRPDSVSQGEEHSVLWLYENRGNRDVSLLLFPLVDVNLRTDQKETLFVELQDDLVKRYWIINDEN